MWHDGILLSNDIAVGNCVIVNDIDRPCSQLIAVVISTSKGIRCRYLNSEIDNGKTIIGDNTVPLKCFGVEVFFKHVDKKIIFWSKQTSASIATYKDGTARLWQDYGLVGLYDAKPDVFMIADEAIAVYES